MRLCILLIDETEKANVVGTPPALSSATLEQSALFGKREVVLHARESRCGGAREGRPGGGERL